MSNINTTETESPSSGFFEKFLIWFLIPIVFTIALLFVLFYILDVDITKKVQSALHNIPVIGKVIPAPKGEEETAVTTEDVMTPEKVAAQKDEEIVNLKAQIAELQSRVQQSGQSSSSKEQEVQTLKAQVQSLEEQLKLKAKTDEEYNQQVQELANVYSKMNPSKAAPIMENLTLQESVLVMSMMKTDDRVKVLEKMNPKRAAEISIAMKDSAPLEDLEMEALRARLDVNEKEKSTGEAEKLSETDLGQTFANMTPKSAATVLLEMFTVTPSEVISILTEMDSASRSKIMTSLSELDKELTAEIALKLGE
jgi:flagellar motility protein MotE (MotC chaperone)